MGFDGVPPPRYDWSKPSTRDLGHVPRERRRQMIVDREDGLYLAVPVGVLDTEKADDLAHMVTQLVESLSANQEVMIAWGTGLLADD